MTSLRPSWRLLTAGAIALLAAILVLADEQATTERDGLSGPPPVMVSFPGTGAGAFIEDTSSTVLHWKADDWNMVRFPENLSGTGWYVSPVGGTLTNSNTPAPDGTLTAWDYTYVAGSSVLFRPFVVTKGNATRTYSVWVRTESGTLNGSIDFQADYTPNNCKAVTFTPTWTLFSNTATQNPVGHIEPAVYPHVNCNTGSTASPGKLIVWHPQLVVGPVPLPYKSPPITNLLASPSAFDNAVWTKSVGGTAQAPVVTADQAFAPDGTKTADKIDFSATTLSGDRSIIYQAPPTGARVFPSVWLKAVSTPCTVYFDYYGSATIRSTACTAGANWTQCALTPPVYGASALILGPDAAAGTDQPISQPACSVYAWNAQAYVAAQNGDTFAMNGTVPLVGTTPAFPRGTNAGRIFVGPYSAANRFYTGAPLAVSNTSATMCAAFAPLVLETADLAVDSGLNRWLLSLNVSGSAAFTVPGVLALPSANSYLLNTLNVLCGGENGTTAFTKLNLGTTASGTAAMGSTPGAITVGAFASGALPFSGRISEVWITNTPWSEERVAAIEARALSYGGQGPLFLDDVNTVAHFIGNGFDGVAWRSPQVSMLAAGAPPSSGAWVPPPAGTLNAPGYGPTSSSNYLSLGSNSDVLDFTGDFSACIVGVKRPADNPADIFEDGISGSTGYGLQVNGAGTTILVFDGATGNPGSTDNNSLNGYNVWCFGRAGGTGMLKTNLGTLATVTGANTGYVAGTATAAKLGTGRNNAGSGAMLEAWFSNDVPSDALFTKIQRRVFQQQTAQGQPIGVTRTTTTSYSIPASAGQTLFYAPAGIVAQTPNGAQVYRQFSNLATQSEVIDTSPWASGGSPTITGNAYVAPDGQTTMDKVTGSVTNDRYAESVTVPSSVGPFTFSAWVRADTGTSVESVVVGTGGTPVSCTCGRDDGGACTPVISGNNCTAYATVGTTPIRLWAAAVAPAAITNVGVYVAPGQFGTTTGIGGFWGMQLETGVFAPGPYVPTVASTVQRNSDVVTVPNPIQPQDTSWCVQGTYTPGYGRAWLDMAGTSHTLWAMTPLNYDSPNSARLEVVGPKLSFVLNDSMGVQSRLDYKGAIAAGTHDVKACVAKGRLALYLDGALARVGKTTITGDWRSIRPGSWSVSPTSVSLGSRVDGTSFWDGWVRDFTILRDRLSASDLQAIDALIASGMDWSASGPLIDDDAGTVLHWTANGNLVRFPESLETAAWTSSGGVAVTPDTDLAPNNTLTADTVYKTASDTSARLQSIGNACVAGKACTVSMYLKAGSVSYTAVSYGLYCGGWPTTVLSARVESGPGGTSTGSAPTVTGLSPTQWTRVSLSVIPDNPGCSVQIFPGGNGSATGYAIKVWGVQVVRGTQPLPYTSPVSTGDTFAMTGTVSAVDTPLFPSGANVRRALGPFTDSDYFSSATAPVSGSADKTICVAFDLPPGTPAASLVLADDGGMTLQTSGGALYATFAHGGSLVLSGNGVTLGALNVACGGTTGSATTKFVRLNQGATVSNGAAAVTASMLDIGRYRSNTYFWPGRIYEVWETTTAWDEALVSQQITRALSQGDGSKSLFLPDANTVVHLKGNDFSGGTTWAGDYPYNVTTVGAPAYSDRFPEPLAGTRARLSAGPFTSSNYMSLGSGTDVLDFTGDYSACLVFLGGAANGMLAFDGTTASTGWAAQVGPTPVAGSFWASDSGSTSAVVKTANGAARGINIGCFGRSGSTLLAKLNLGTVVSQALGHTISAGTGTAAYLGNTQSGNDVAWNSGILEAWFSATTPSDALFTTIQQKVLGHLTASGAVVANSRSTTATYEVPRGTDVAQTLFTAPANVTPTTPYGRGYWRQVSNVLTYSEQIDQWSQVGSCPLSVNSATFVDGQTTMDTVTCSGNSDERYVNGTVASGTGPFTASSWVRAVSGSQTESVLGTCAGSSISTCTCGRADGQSCTATISGTACLTYSTYSTTPVRSWATWTCGAATTTVQAFLHDGQWGTSAGVGGIYGGVQLEVGGFPTPYIPTTTSAVQRNEDRESLSVSVPNGSPWCMDTTILTYGGRPWSAGGIQVLMGWGTWPIGNSAALYLSNSAIILGVYDGAVAYRQNSISSIDTVLPAGVSHRVTACSDLNIYVDGVKQAANMSGAGTGAISTSPGTAYVGYAPGVSTPQPNAFIQGARLCTGTLQQCLAQPL